MAAHFQNRTSSPRETIAALACAAGLVIGLAGCGTPTAKKQDFEPVVAQFFMEAPEAAPNAIVMRMPRSGIEISVSPRHVMSESDVANVELVQVDLGLCLLFEFQGEAARGVYRLTAGNLGRRIVVALNGRAFGARVIDGPIGDGRLFMFVEMGDAELTATAVNLKRTTEEIQAALSRRPKA